VLELSFRISNFVLPLTTRISCPFVPENEPTTAVLIAEGGESVRLRRCMVKVRIRSEYGKLKLFGPD